MRSLRFLPLVGAVALALAACTSGSTPAANTTASSDNATVPSREVVLNVYAAASLTETFEELEGLRVKMCVWLGVSRGLDLAFLNAD